MASIEIARIRGKLDDLQQRDASFSVFGSGRHRYKLNPTMHEPEIRQFERAHSVTLPSEYRSFLLECGNGGAGPYYGLFPLGYFDGSGGPLETWSEGDGFAGILSRPFPHETAWRLPSDRYTPPDLFRCAEEEKIWYQTLNDETWRPELIAGAFPICHQGCAVRNCLVISGAERGKVWVDDRANDNGIFPETSETSERVGFLEWYESWLDESLAAVG